MALGLRTWDRERTKKEGKYDMTVIMVVGVAWCRCVVGVVWVCCGCGCGDNSNGCCDVVVGMVMVEIVVWDSVMVVGW